MANNNSSSTLETLTIMYIAVVVALLLGGWPFYLAYKLCKWAYALGRDVYFQGTPGALLSAFGGIFLGLGAGMMIECGIFDGIGWLMAKPMLFPLSSPALIGGCIMSTIGVVTVFRSEFTVRLQYLLRYWFS